jgi:hypothetical protein
MKILGVAFANHVSILLQLELANTCIWGSVNSCQITVKFVVKAASVQTMISKIMHLYGTYLMPICSCTGWLQPVHQVRI